MSYCTDCIHYKVCGNEGVDDSAMTFCADKQTDGDLISRDYVLSKFKEQCDRCGKYKENNGVMCRCCALDDAIDYIEDAPSAEKTAEWIDLGYKDEWWCEVGKCSKCGKETILGYNYCPHCGARMKGEQTK